MFNKISGDFFLLENSNSVYPEGSIQVGRVFVEVHGSPSRVIVLKLADTVNGVESGISRSGIHSAPYIVVETRMREPY